MKNLNADGLRGTAALCVAISHFITAYLPTMMHKTHPGLFRGNDNPSILFDIFTFPLVSIFYNGHFAVLIFFVLSGYVLTLPYFSNPSIYKTILLKRLWGRYFRLNIPIAAAIAISFVIYQLGFYQNIPAGKISGSSGWFDLFYQPGLTALMAIKEAVYSSITLGQSQFLPPVWTLKVEFIGSLYVLLFYILKPKNYLLLPIAIALILLHVVHRESSIYFFAIFFGSLISLARVNRKMKPYLFFIGIYFGGFQFESVLYDYLPQILIWERKTFYNTLGAVFLTTSIVSGFGEKFFTSRIIQFLGKISFSIYLLHFIILCSISSFLYVALPQGEVFLMLNFLIYLSLCLISSRIFEVVVDHYSINISHQFASYVQLRSRQW